MRLTIAMVTPAPPGSRAGNRISALRYARLWRSLGHRTRILTRWDGAPCDALVVLNGHRGALSVLRARKQRPDLPIVVVLTGTDVYEHLGSGRRLPRALDAADRIVGLQSDCVRILPSRWRRKARTILQSYDGPRLRWKPTRGKLELLLLGHLRSEKDPFRAALALRRLSPESRVSVLQAGKAMRPALGARAHRESATNPRYRYLGELSRPRALARLASSSALLSTSRIEGGPSVFSEALAIGVPILSSRIPAAESILSPRHPGLFPVGDTAALAELMRRVEEEPSFLARLAQCSRALAPQVEPSRERAAWKRLWDELGPGTAGSDPRRSRATDLRARGAKSARRR